MLFICQLRNARLWFGFPHFYWDSKLTLGDAVLYLAFISFNLSRTPKNSKDFAFYVVISNIISTVHHSCVYSLIYYLFWLILAFEMTTATTDIH